MPRTFAKPSIMEWDGNKITDHNRSELGIGVTRIETMKRMANGIMRKHVIADKRTFSVSWTNLPNKDDFTVDGFWGGKEMEAWYDSKPGPFTLKITNGDGTSKSYLVMMTNFDKDIVKRGKMDLWTVRVEMEEV